MDEEYPKSPYSRSQPPRRVREGDASQKYKYRNPPRWPALLTVQKIYGNGTSGCSLINYSKKLLNYSYTSSSNLNILHLQSPVIATLSPRAATTRQTKHSQLAQVPVPSRIFFFRSAPKGRQMHLRRKGAPDEGQCVQNPDCPATLVSRVKTLALLRTKPSMVRATRQGRPRSCTDHWSPSFVRAMHEAVPEGVAAWRIGHVTVLYTNQEAVSEGTTACRISLNTGLCASYEGVVGKCYFKH